MSMMGLTLTELGGRVFQSVMVWDKNDPFSGYCERYTKLLLEYTSRHESMQIFHDYQSSNLFVFSIVTSKTSIPDSGASGRQPFGSSHSNSTESTPF